MRAGGGVVIAVVAAAAALQLGLGCSFADGKEPSPPPPAAKPEATPRTPSRDAGASSRDGAAAGATKAKETTEKNDGGPSRAPVKSTRGSRKPAPPVPSPQPRHHCNRTYCDGSGNCFSPSPPNCIP